MTALSDAAPATVAHQVAANTALTAIQTTLATPPLPAAAATGAKQDTANAALGTIAAPFAAATSAPLTATDSDTATHTYGPFTPQLAREIWLTLNATVAASGTAQLLRSVDGGTTKIGLTAGGGAIGAYTFTAVTGAIVNEIIGVETEAAATYYLTITLTAGTVKCRVAQ